MTELKQLLASHGAVWDWLHGREVASHFGDAAAESAALEQATGLADFSDRTQVEFTGADQASFLHNMCTADVKRLQPGQGCEAFFTNAQGKILAFAYTFAGVDSHVVETVPGQGGVLVEHLDRYLFTEDVQMADRSADWAELLLAGAAAAELLAGLADAALPAELLDHSDMKIADQPVSVRRVDFTGPVGFLLSCPRDSIAPLWTALHAAGATPVGAEAVEVARLEAGTPLYGVDVSDANLPQEVDRDERAISFTKGCYIGQETVARIDAMGHVNWKLRGLRFPAGPLPDAPAEVQCDGKTVARLTSVVVSRRLSAPLALAYVRRERAQPGTQLPTSCGTAEVVRLPVPRPQSDVRC